MAANKTPAPARSIEEIALNALHEAKEDWAEACKALAEDARLDVAKQLPKAAAQMLSIKDEVVASAALRVASDNAPLVAAAQYHEGYKQACEDMVTEMQAFLKGLN